MPDPDHLMQRLKHTVVNTPGIPHTWQKGTIFSNKTTEIGTYFEHKTCTHGIASGNIFYTEHVANLHN